MKCFLNRGNDSIPEPPVSSVGRKDPRAAVPGDQEGNGSVCAEGTDIEICDAQDGHIAAQVFIQINHGIGRGCFQGTRISRNGLAQEGVVDSGNHLAAQVGHRDIAGAGQGFRSFVKEGFKFFGNGGIRGGRPAALQGTFRGGGGDHHQKHQDEGNQFFHFRYFLSCSVFPAALIQTPGIPESSMN